MEEEVKRALVDEALQALRQALRDCDTLRTLRESVRFADQLLVKAGADVERWPGAKHA